MIDRKRVAAWNHFNHSTYDIIEQAFDSLSNKEFISKNKAGKALSKFHPLLHYVIDIHGVGKDKTTAWPRVRTFAEFKGDAEFVWLINYETDPNQEPIDRMTVVETALSYSLHPTFWGELWGEYDAVFNNCESFAVLCRTGNNPAIPEQSVRLAKIVVDNICMSCLKW